MTAASAGVRWRRCRAAESDAADASGPWRLSRSSCELVEPGAARRSACGRRPAAEPLASGDRPVARVAVDVSLPHLDRPFDYLVPGRLADGRPAGRPGAGAVRRPARRRLRRSSARPSTEHAGTAGLARARWSRPSRCSTPEVARAGPGGRRPLRRHARRRAAARRARRGTPATEAAAVRRRARSRRPEPAPRRPGRWARLPGRAGVPRAPSRAGARPGPSGPRCPAPSWPVALADGGRAPRCRGGPRRAGRRARRPRPRPGRRRADRGLLGAGQHVALTADLGPAERYRRFLRGPPRRGPRASSAPGPRSSRRSRDLGPGRGLGRRRRPARRAARAVPARPRGAAHCGPRAEGAALLVGGHARTAEAQPARRRRAGRTRSPPTARHAARASRRRSRRPATTPSWAATPAAARGPAAAAWPGAPPARRCAAGPVLVQVPARGYVPGAGLRRRAATPARCPTCAGPLGPTSGARGRRPAGGAAGRRPAAPAAHCGGRRLRAPVVGAGAHGRGARPGLPGRARCARRAATRCSPTVPGGAGARRRDARRRAGRRRRLRRGAAARRLGAARPARPAGRRGDAAPVAAPRRRWSGRPPTGGRSWSWPSARSRPCRRSCAGTRPGFADRELAERRELRLPPAAADGRRSPAPPAALAGSSPPPSCRPRRGARPVAVASPRTRRRRTGAAARAGAARAGARAGRGAARRGRRAQRAQGRRQPSASRSTRSSSPEPARMPRRPAADGPPPGTVVFDLGGVLDRLGPALPLPQADARGRESKPFLAEVGFPSGTTPRTPGAAGPRRSSALAAGTRTGAT